MKNEHATCRANDIKQKRLLGGNPAKKKIRFAFFFLIFYFSHFTLFLSFSYIPFLLFQYWGQCCVLSVGVLGECWFSYFDFLCCTKKKQKQISMFDLLNFYWFIRMWVLYMRINWDRWRYKFNEGVCMQVLRFNWFRDWLWEYVMLTL